MYPVKSIAHVPAAKELINQDSATRIGLSTRGNFCWLLSRQLLLAWDASDALGPTRSFSLAAGHGEALQELALLQHHQQASGLTAVGVSPAGALHSWLNALTQVTPVRTPVPTPDPAPVVAFAAAPLVAMDAPGFVAVLCLSDSSLVSFSGGAAGVAAVAVRPGEVRVRQQGLLNAIAGAMAKESASWMHRMAAGADRSGLLAKIGNFLTRKPREAASDEPARDVCVQHMGSTSWLALTLTGESIDCWHFSRTAAQDTATSCLWSLDVRLSLSRECNAGQVQPLRFALVADALCMLCAVQRHRSGRSVWFLALAFYRLPTAGLGMPSDAAVELPECLFFQESAHEVAEEVCTPQTELGTLPRGWRLAVRPDAPDVVAAQQLATMVFVLKPTGVGSGAATQCLCWHHMSGFQNVLPEVSDASAVMWSPSEAAWELLSPIFGCLYLKDVGHGGGGRLPVGPLLEAAIARYHAGAPVPSLATALHDLGALAGSQPGECVVERFSLGLVDSLPKPGGADGEGTRDRASASGAHMSVAAALAHKKKAHDGLLQCLHIAGLLPGHGARVRSGHALQQQQQSHHQLPPAAVFGIFEHAIELAAVAALFHDLVAAAPAADGALTPVQLHQAYRLLAERAGPQPTDTTLSKEEELISRPAASTRPLLVAISGTLTDPSSPRDLLGPLAALLASLLRGAGAAQRALVARFGTDFLAMHFWGAPGVLAGSEARGAAVAVVEAALCSQEEVSVEWAGRLLDIAEVFLAGVKRAVQCSRFEEDPDAAAEALVLQAQRVVGRLVDRIYDSVCVGVSPLDEASGALLPLGAPSVPGHEAAARELRGRLQALAATELEEVQLGVGGAPRIASARHLFHLLDDDIQRMHVRACRHHPGAQLLQRLLPELPAHLHGFTGLTVSSTLPVLSAEEQAARARLHSHMGACAAFRAYALQALVDAGRTLELLVLPTDLHKVLREFLATKESLAPVLWLHMNATGDSEGAALVLRQLGQAARPTARALLGGGCGADPATPPSQVAGTAAAATRRRACVLRKATLLLQRKAARSGSVSTAAAAAGGIDEALLDCEAQLASTELWSGLCAAAGEAVEGELETMLRLAASLPEGPQLEHLLLSAVHLASRLLLCTSWWLEVNHDIWNALWSRIGLHDAVVFTAAATEAGIEDMVMSRGHEGTLCYRALRKVKSTIESAGWEGLAGAATSRALDGLLLGVQQAGPDPAAQQMLQAVHAVAMQA